MTDVDIRVLGVPATLPPRGNTGPLRRLSMSAVNEMAYCAEAFRRKRIQPYTWPGSAFMVLGSAVDQAVEHWVADHLRGGSMTPANAAQWYWDVGLSRALADRKIGALTDLTFDKTGDSAETARLGGFRATELYVTSLIEDYLPEWEIASAQEAFDFKVSPQVAWNVTGVLDLLLRHRRDPDVWMIRDLKIRGNDMSQASAMWELQGPLYLLGMRLRGRERCYFGYDSINRMAGGPQWRPYREEHLWRPYDRFLRGRGERFGCGLIRVEVPNDPLLITRAVRRVEMAAKQLHAYHDAFGADRHWPGVGDGIANDFRCVNCDLRSSCPSGGLLLQQAAGAPSWADITASLRGPQR